jgi:hypothetical protein
MAVGMTDRLWGISDIIGMREDAEPRVSECAPTGKWKRSMLRDEDGAEEKLDGFPLPIRERNTLDNCNGVFAGRPLGAGGVTLTNLVGRGWIVRTERPLDYFAELCLTPSEGRVAIEFDDLALKAGFARPRPGVRAPGIAAIKDLPAKLAQFKISI